MKQRFIVALCLIVAGRSGMSIAAQPAFAASLCVGSGSGCSSTIQAALDAAHNGDMIRLGPGTFAGGISITKSVQIMGAGAGSTSIQGGGPVVTIGTADGTTEPIVSITGVTIRGGLNTSSPVPFVPQGGGLSVLPGTGFTTGATVTIMDSVITGNRVAPSANGDCGSPCTFSVPLGGGISNGGAMTLTNTIVSNNQAANLNAAAVYTGAIGGGIESFSVGSLTLHDSTVTANRVLVTTATSTNPGAFGGGIDSGGPLTVDDSSVSNNQVTVTSTSTDPNSDVLALGGGIRYSASATIRGSQIVGNRVAVTVYGGNAGSGAGGISTAADDASLLLVGSSVSDNHTSLAATTTLGHKNTGTDAGAMEAGGFITIKGTTFNGNSTSMTSAAGIADAGGGAIFIWTSEPATITQSVFSGNSASATAASGPAIAQAGAIINFGLLTITDSAFTGNSVHATATSGTATAQGGSLANDGTLQLRNTTVGNNSGTASGSNGTAQGGGIWNGDLGNGPPQLTLLDSPVTHNSLTGSSGITVQGGGLYTTAPVTLTNSVIAQNSPDQCYGC